MKKNQYCYFPSLTWAWRISGEVFFEPLMDTFSDLKLRVGYGVTGNQEFPGGVSLAVFNANSDGSITQVNNPNPDIKWKETTQWGMGLDFEFNRGSLSVCLDYFITITDNRLIREHY